MKKSHSGFWVGIAVFFLAAVYSIILFLVKPNFNITAWVLYGATMISFLLFGIQAMASARNNTTVITDSALGAVTTVYFGLQLVFGGIVCMCFNDVPLTPVIICEIIWLAAYLVIAFLMYAAQSSNIAQDQNDRKAVQKIRFWESDIQGMMEEATDPTVKKALNDLAETIHYSDVVSLPGLADTEERIAQNIAVLQDDLKEENGNPLTRIDTLRRLLKERDRMAAVLKR